VSLPADFTLLVVRGVSLLVALSITVTSYRAYRRTGERTFGFTFAGFVLLTLGVGIESFLLRALRRPILEVHTIESILFALGFILLYLSFSGSPEG